MMKRLTTIIGFVFLITGNYIALGQTVSQQSVVPTPTTAAVSFYLSNAAPGGNILYRVATTLAGLGGATNTVSGGPSTTATYYGEARNFEFINLNSNTLYYWDVYFYGSGGSTSRTGGTFTTSTGGAPSVRNLSVTTTTSSTASINCETYANGVNTDVTYQYGVTTNDLRNNPQEFSAAQISSSIGFYEGRPITLTNLQPNTTYTWRVKVQNSVGSVISYENTFTTLANNSAPIISNVSATELAPTSAKILYRVENGTFTSRILYGTTSGALNSSKTGTAGNADLSTNSILTGLTPNTRYYYQVEVTNNISTVLSPEQSFTTPVESLIAEFRFNGNKSNIGNSLTFGAGANTFVPDRNLQTNSALQFANNRISVAIPSLPLSKTARTVSIWAKFDSYVSTNYNFIYGYGTSQNNKAYGVAIYKDASNVHTVRNYAYADEIVGTPNPFDVLAWHHYVTTYDGTTAKLYVDGVLRNTTAKTTWDTNSSSFFLGGNSFGDSNFTGAIDDLLIYGRVLSAQEVSNLYSNNTLPVTLIFYTAKAQNNNAVLNWKTASETNNSHFVVEKSTDGTNFNEIAKVNAKSANGADYVYTDYNTNSGTNYYRLTQVDLDGKTTNLGVKAVKMSLADAEVKLYPNPATDFVNLSFEAGVYSAAVLVDINGKVMSTLSIAKVQNTATINLSSVNPGTYLVQLVGANSKTIKKVIKR